MKKLDLSNRQFGRLLVKKRLTGRLWLCRCVCGIEKSIPTGNLTSGQTQSCGCLRLERVQENLKRAREVRIKSAKHFISNIDHKNLMGDCSLCGKTFVKVAYFSNRAPVYRCWVEKVGAKVAFPNQLVEMFESQKGNCAVCGEPMAENGRGSEGPSLDHSHVNGSLRGIVHNRCNRGIGQFKDDPIYFV